MNKPEDARAVASVDLWIAASASRPAGKRYGEVTNPALGTVVPARAVLQSAATSTPP
jgi:hypothetical protein